jgi:hypothetical protein
MISLFSFNNEKEIKLNNSFAINEFRIGKIEKLISVKIISNLFQFNYLLLIFIFFIDKRFTKLILKWNNF